MGLSDEVIRQLTQVSLPITPVECDFRLPFLHKCPDAAPRLQDAQMFQFRIDLRHCVRVDLQLDRQLPHRRQLVADSQLSRGNRELYGSLELVIKRRRMFGVYVEHILATLYYDNRTS